MGWAELLTPASNLSVAPPDLGVAPPGPQRGPPGPRRGPPGPWCGPPSCGTLGLQICELLPQKALPLWRGWKDHMT